MRKKSRDIRVNFIQDVKKKRVSNFDFRWMIKYSFDHPSREYILKKLPIHYTQLAYDNPLPTTDEKICQISGILNDDATMMTEINWFFDSLLRFEKEINLYIEFKKDVEDSLLIGDYEKCLDLLDDLEFGVCCSYYGLLTEMYVNELSGNEEANKELVKSLSIDEESTKLPILLEFARIRISSKYPTWQYDASVEQHRKQYPDDARDFMDYIMFKFEPIRHEEGYQHLLFVLFYESDFSIIDRYNSLKKLLPIIFEKGDLIDSDKDLILGRVKELCEVITDSYWVKFLILHGVSLNQPMQYINIELANKYNTVQDYYLEGNYNKLLDYCKSTFEIKPSFSEIYIFFCKSLIIAGKELEAYIEKKHELYKLLDILLGILRKDQNYISNRDKLLEKYYSICQFDFSISFLEFIYNEYNIHIPMTAKQEAFLGSNVIRYNTYNLLQNPKESLLFDNLYPGCQTFNLIEDNLIGNNNVCTTDSSFFKFKIIIGILIHIGKYQKALIELEKMYEIQSFQDMQYIRTWAKKNQLRCYVKTNAFEKASDLIVDNFFESGQAYDHYFDQNLIDELENLEDEELYRYLSIPVLFKVYNQSQSQIYDCIANFLIQYDAFKPSEIIEFSSKFPLNKFIYFLEMVCTQDNISDSPFLNTIEQLEEERIVILNHLKEINPEKEELYNDEILKITKEATIRKGVLQIHESRIYVDTQNISKVVEVELPEIFDRYLELDDITYSGISNLQLNQQYDHTNMQTTYYFKEPVDEALLELYLMGDPLYDKNAIQVPIIRYSHFELLFNDIKDQFVYNEDFGFKSFLSMRIRHGTFSNVLRSIFDNYKIISSKEADSDDYQDILHWNTKLNLSNNQKNRLQKLLKKFSRQIDEHIDLGLSWIKIKDDETEIQSMFDFEFSKAQMAGIFRNRLGRIQDYSEFIQETFNVLYDRLEKSLKLLRGKISSELSPLFIKYIENLQKEVENIGLNSNDYNLIEQEIISCKTDIQVVSNQIESWFKVSKNQYIEEFPIDMILQSSLDYVNSINRNIISEATVKTTNNCNLKFNGKFFESFGDMFITIFDNVIGKNKDLGNELKIDIGIEHKNQNLEMTVKNNLSKTTNIEILKKKVDEIMRNVTNYKKGELTSSFEEGSGFLKICKCISADLERDEYSVIPSCTNDSFQVKIMFKLNNNLLI